MTLYKKYIVQNATVQNDTVKNATAQKCHIPESHSTEKPYNSNEECDYMWILHMYKYRSKYVFETKYIHLKMQLYVYTYVDVYKVLLYTSMQLIANESKISLCC